MIRFCIRFTIYASLCAFFAFMAAAHFILPNYLEGLLTRLFDLPVQIDSAIINPISGKGAVTNIRFENPPGFSKAPHLHADKIYFQIDLAKLSSKHVAMDFVYLENIYFLIEKRARNETNRSNIRYWLQHMRSRRQRNPDEPKKPSGWRVTIDHIEIIDGRFVYDSRKDYDLKQQYQFDRLFAELKGFEWPSRDPMELNQTLRLTARIGEEYPAPLEIHGKADFATRYANFDLTGVIPSGQIQEFERFWSHLPVRVESGQYRLETRFQCVDRNLITENTLEIHNLDVKTQGTALDRLWGVPWVTMIKFLESKKLVRLNIPVTGKINNPNFEYSRAFSEAVKNGISQHVSTGIKTFVDTPVQLAAQTKEIVTLGVDVGKKIVTGQKTK